MSAEDIQACMNLWSWCYESSEEFFLSLVHVNGGFGVFDESTGELLSFGLINDHLAIGGLNTVEKARGRKFAEIIAKLLTRKLVEEMDLNPTTYVDNTNVPSFKLFEKLGYRKAADCNWIFIQNKKQ